MKKLKIFVQYKHPISAITSYRLLQPLKLLEEQGKVELIEDELDLTMPDELRAEMIGMADVAFSHAVAATTMFRDYRMMQDIPPRFNPLERVVDYSAPWVLDIDDAYDWVSPTNPAFGTWGVRDMSGEMLGEGGKIIATLQDGKQVTLYEDGKKAAQSLRFKKGVNYYYKQNIMRIARLKTAIKESACVTVTTEELKKHVQESDKPFRVEVLPNCMLRRTFPDITTGKHSGVRVLWQGGGSHYDDWASVRDAMVEATKRFPQIKWVVFGQDYTPLLRGGGVPEDRMEYHTWVEYPAHKYQLALLGCDINLAIIQPNQFSRGKSGIKFYEASALKKPIPTLATNAPPYTEIEDGKTGLLYDGPEEFVEKLGQLVENASLRRELASNAQDWVWENRDAEKWAPKMLELFEELKEHQIKKQGDLRELFGAKEGDLVAHNQYVPEEEESAVPI